MSNVESTNIKSQSQVESEKKQEQPPQQQTTRSLQEVNLQQQPFPQEQLPPQTTETQGVIGGAAVVTTKIQVIPTVFGQIGLQQKQGQHQRVSVTNTSEPTINLFNSYCAKDTHCILGRTGVKICRVNLGTMNFGEIDPRFGKRPGQLSESDAHKILDRYLELGGNCIDTADFFPWFGDDAGKTETIIGNWLANQQRDRVFLITKVRMPMDPSNINSIGLSRCHLFNAVNASLKRLQTTWIDMLVLNGWDNSVSFHDTARNLNDLVAMDKIRYIGAADFKGWQLQKLIDIQRNQDLHRCVCYMGEYNLLTRGLECEVLDVCKRERVGFIAYSPTKYGFLSDETVQSGVSGPLPGSRIESANASNLAAMAESFQALRRNPVNMNTLNLCHLLSRKYKVSVSQIAIQWLLQTGVVTSVCIGVHDVSELDENMSCLLGEFILSQEDIEDLNAVSNNPHHYPYHTQLAEILGTRCLVPIPNKTEFEQLSVQLVGDSFELRDDEVGGIRRLNLKETCHESLNQALPERDFMRHIQMKTEPSSMGHLQSNIVQQSQEQQGRLIQ